mgnify:CR=1 FL=1
MKTVGVILARLQPIHNGHLALISKASKENEEVHVFIVICHYMVSLTFVTKSERSKNN